MNLKQIITTTTLAIFLNQLPAQVQHVIEPTDIHYGYVDMTPIGEPPQFPAVPIGEPHPNGEKQLSILRRITGNGAVGWGINHPFTQYPVPIYPGENPHEEVLTGIHSWDTPGQPSNFTIINYDPIEAGEPGIRIQYDNQGARADMIRYNGTIIQGTAYVPQSLLEHEGFRKKILASIVAHEVGHNITGLLEHEDDGVLMSASLTDTVAELINQGTASQHTRDMLEAIKALGPAKSWNNMYDSNTPITEAKEENQQVNMTNTIPLIANNKMYQVARHQTTRDGCTITWTDIQGPKTTQQELTTYILPQLQRLETTLELYKNQR